jgi:hypothetical protein
MKLWLVIKHKTEKNRPKAVIGAVWADSRPEAEKKALVVYGRPDELFVGEVEEIA